MKFADALSVELKGYYQLPITQKVKLVQLLFNRYEVTLQNLTSFIKTLSAHHLQDIESIKVIAIVITGMEKAQAWSFSEFLFGDPRVAALNHLRNHYVSLISKDVEHQLHQYRTTIMSKIGRQQDDYMDVGSAIYTSIFNTNIETALSEKKEDLQLLCKFTKLTFADVLDAARRDHAHAVTAEQHSRIKELEEYEQELRAEMYRSVGQ